MKNNTIERNNTIYYKDYIKSCRAFGISPRVQMWDIIKLIKGRKEPELYDLVFNLIDLDLELLEDEEISIIPYCCQVMNIIQDYTTGAKIKEINIDNELTIKYKLSDEKKQDLKTLWWIYNELEIITYRLRNEYYY